MNADDAKANEFEYFTMKLLFPDRNRLTKKTVEFVDEVKIDILKAEKKNDKYFFTVALDKDGGDVISSTPYQIRMKDGSEWIVVDIKLYQTTFRAELEAIRKPTHKSQ